MNLKKSMMKRGRYDSDKTPYYEKPIKKIKQHAVINLDDFVDSDDADSDDVDSDNSEDICVFSISKCVISSLKNTTI